MKQLTITLLTLLFFGAGLAAHAQETKVKTETGTGKKMKMKQDGDHTKMKSDMTAQHVDLPYPVTYSSQFVMGNPAQAKMILDLYKAYETKNFSGENPFADTATMILPDGQVFKGNAIQSVMTQGRDAVSNITFSITAVMPVHSVDRDEDWVLVWGTQTYETGPGNGAVSSEIHSIWRINKDQKITFAHLFEGKTPM